MIAIIGGSGLNNLSALEQVSEKWVDTPYSEGGVLVTQGHLPGVELPVCFLPRHGKGHVLPPHRINYRANLYALHELGVRAVLAVNAVGGITSATGPGAIVIPDQIIDYTWGREHTFFDGSDSALSSPDKFSQTVAHVDMTYPYDESLRTLLQDASVNLRHPVVTQAVYGATQGPRLETPAEIKRLAQDGCDIVGMTGMPEAALARELGMAYASLALSVNWAAGISQEEITMEAIHRVLEEGMAVIEQLLLVAVQRYSDTSNS
ncbi:S-methyl-5'-thioinosine phosphorylase [Pseudohongiella nitratireducens]|uniref:S-methyl-5'-thioinosine phosphorylase n=1 Tax=Pseudohongiella nitratireducens TaxID=1768907 RepID=UPI0024094FF6|nr:S-methyl-5'-thioinosine phosphorylase [Pseudohongiella nitratireducens]MDF1624018.1 S-methyl-5'-thioinosine phosphorylase [Pseudohongiella nitratireducens]|tara:strand:+ start:167 stop:955 length:789 start_codon:yes stop_codon:yes gene_type:complete